MRNVFGTWSLLRLSLFGRGAATPSVVEFVISLTAEKIFFPIFSLLSFVRFSFSNGMASSLLSARFSHSL